MLGSSVRRTQQRLLRLNVRRLLAPPRGAAAGNSAKVVASRSRPLSDAGGGGGGSNNFLAPLATTDARAPAKPGATTSVDVLEVREWIEVTDKDTSETYYWCEATGETTPVGADRPKRWAKVQASEGEPYWWCEETAEVTAVGAPCPGPYDVLSVSGAQTTSVGRGLGSMVVTGFAIGLGFAAVRLVLG